MQHNAKSTPALDIATRAATDAPVPKTAPIELDFSVLKHVSGGSPKGTWQSFSVESPKGTW